MTNISRIEAHSSSTEAIAELSADLKDELATSDKEAGLLAVRYCELKAAKYLIPATGEVLDKGRYEREMDGIATMLREYIERTQDRPFVEGVGSLRLQERKGTPEYDTKAIYASARTDFLDALELGVMEISHKKASPHMDDRLSWLKRWLIPGKPSTALVIERDDR